MDKSRPEQPTQLRLDLRVVSAGASMIAVAALTTLLIVINMSGADSLAAVALVLAILAFVIQIVVFIADSYISSQRDHAAQRLHEETQNLLTEIRVSSAATVRAVDGNLTKLLDAFIGATKGNPGYLENLSADERSPFFSGLAAVRQEASRQHESARSTSASEVSIVRSWPSEHDVQQLIATGLPNLPDKCFPLLDILAMDVLSSYMNGTPQGSLYDPSHYGEAAIALEQAGLARQEDVRLVPTHRGLLAAALIAAPDPVPEAVLALWPDLPSVRARSKH